jgi:hypothetical protein
MAFMCRVRVGISIPTAPPREDFALRMLICLIFAIGVIYAILIINTLRRYGTNMDEAWKCRIDGFRRQPSKSREDDFIPSNDPRSPRSPEWEVVPPTPSTETPLSFCSDTLIQPPTNSPQISPSLTRRAESADTLSVAERDAIQPLSAITSAFRASPEPMAPLEVSNTMAGSSRTNRPQSS